MTILTLGDIAIVHVQRRRHRHVLVRASCATSKPAPPSISPTMAGSPPADSAPAKARSRTRHRPRWRPAAIITLSGLDLDAAGDQIIAYQGDPATPTILHLVDFADGNNTVAGDATDANTTALPPGFTLGVNAVAVGVRQCDLCRPDQRIPSAAVPPHRTTRPTGSMATHCPRRSVIFYAGRTIDLDANNSTSGGVDYRA